MDILSGPELLRNWSLLLFGTEKPAETQIQSTADLTQQLWSKFNTMRDHLERDYMSADKNLQAYLASFYIPNVERTRNILSAPVNAIQLEKIVQNETVNVIDFGAGPLSASAGLLLALNALRSRLGKEAFKCKEIHICAVERSEKAFNKGLQILNRTACKDVIVKATRATSIPSDRKFHIALAANVINELPEKHKFKTSLQIAQSLDRSSANFALILEPGQELHSRGLADIRDHLCTSEELKNFAVISPCLHNKECPLSSKKSRNDWCWFKSSFRAPALLEQIDRKSKIQHTELAYSYISFSTNEIAVPQKAGNQLRAIAVSDEMEAGQPADAEKRLDYFKNNLFIGGKRPDNEHLAKLARTGTKTKLCAETGDYLGGLRHSESAQEKLRRGSEIADSTIFDAIIKER
jgi:ribosomal protein RSM22 (predicted rRNA methylase)